MAHRAVSSALLSSLRNSWEKRSQVEEKQRWAQERLAYYEREGLVLEAEKMRHLLRNCSLELREMEMMDAYRKDENQVAQVKFYPRKLKE